MGKKKLWRGLGNVGASCEGLTVFRGCLVLAQVECLVWDE